MHIKNLIKNLSCPKSINECQTAHKDMGHKFSEMFEKFELKWYGVILFGTK